MFPKERYASETTQRMARVVGQLRAATGSVDEVVRQLREQEEAAHLVGFPGVARLCGAMEDYLAETRRGRPPELSEAATLLLEACRTIELHAEAITRGLVNIPSDAADRRNTLK
jgi:chemotaxis protein histidine kinase CheA